MPLPRALALSRPRTLIVLVLALGPAFAVTAAVTRAFHAHERALADERVQAQIAGKPIRKTLVIPGRLVSIVV